MLVTLLVVYYARPVLRCKIRRRKALSALLIAASLLAGDGRLNTAYGQEGFGKVQSVFQSDLKSSDRDLDATEETNLVGGHQKLREGTVLPPTIGRIVNIGRRWAFIPIDDGQSNRGGHAERESDSITQSKSNGSALTRHPDGFAADSHGHSPSIILCENQMLQRIVEATRADASDDRWEISGEILEFFDQNRLLIRTLQRANSN